MHYADSERLAYNALPFRPADALQPRQTLHVHLAVVLCLRSNIGSFCGAAIQIPKGAAAI